MSIQFPFRNLPLELSGKQNSYLLSREDNRELKHGYMSVIYKARELKSNRPVAVKTLWRLQNPTRQEQDFWHKAANQFAIEIESLSKLEGITGIIQVIDQGSHDGLSWYAMEYIEGPNIIAGLRNKTLHEKVRILRRLVKALSEAHRRGVVHMDLKPSNILLIDEKNPIILDFGISKVVEIAWGTISMSTGISGTPRYMAPEQFAGDFLTQTELRKIDIWAIGVLFYEILVTSHPFAILDSDNYGQIAQKITNGDLVYLRDLDPEIDEILAEIGNRALSRKIADRYKHAIEMLHDFNEWETANFNKWIALAQEQLQYCYWTEAKQSALKAQIWFPFHPQVKKCLNQALSGKYDRPIAIEWIDAISPEMISFWIKTRNDSEATFPQSIGKIYYIHSQTPLFLALDVAVGIAIEELCQEREAKGDRLSITEILALLLMLEELLSYASRKRIAVHGLQWGNLYCLLDQTRNISRFYFRGFGWQGNPAGDIDTAVHNILEKSLRRKDGSLIYWQKEVLEQNSLEKMIYCVRLQQQKQETDDEIEDFSGYK